MQEGPAQRAATAIVARLRDAGYQAYFAGGCVRDLLLGFTPKDFDVATSARPDVVLGMFSKTFAVGAHFGVVLVASSLADSQPGLSDDGLSTEITTEVATFRDDGVYADGRHPEAVRFSESAAEDVERRDFTINGMLLDPLRLSAGASLATAVLDYVGGRGDLAAGLVRAIGEPARRFAEDKLRMLRAVRFAARLEFAIEPGTAAEILRQAPTIHQVSCERIRDELTRMLTEGHAAQAIAMLDSTSLLQQLLPEVVRMHGVEQPPEYHPEGGVWVHTLLLLEKLPAGVSPTLAWATLLHDVGKPATFERAPDRIRFNGHAEVGTRMAEAICRRLRFSTAETEQILALVANHMRFGDVEKMKESTLKRFFRLPRFDEHLELHRMDCLASHGILRLHEYARTRYRETPQEEVQPKLLVTGKDLIEAGYRPGPLFKDLLALAEDAQLEGRIQTREQGLELILASRRA